MPKELKTCSDCAKLLNKSTGASHCLWHFEDRTKNHTACSYFTKYSAEKYSPFLNQHAKSF